MKAWNGSGVTPRELAGKSERDMAGDWADEGVGERDQLRTVRTFICVSCVCGEQPRFIYLHDMDWGHKLGGDER